MWAGFSNRRRGLSCNRINRMILVQHIYNLQAILKMATTSESRFYTSFTGNFPSFSYAFLLWNPFDLGKAGLLLVDFAAALTTKLTACTCSCCEAGQQSFLRGSSVVCTPLFTIAVPWRWWSPPFCWFVLVMCLILFDCLCLVPGSFGVRSLRFLRTVVFSHWTVHQMLEFLLLVSVPFRFRFDASLGFSTHKDPATSEISKQHVKVVTGLATNMFQSDQSPKIKTLSNHVQSRNMMRYHMIWQNNGEDIFLTDASQMDPSQPRKR